MVSKFAIRADSAQPDKTKISSISQEIVRRMKNTSRSVSWATRKNILEKYMLKLKRSGYGVGMRKLVLSNAMKGYERMVRDQEEGKGPINRSRLDGANNRRWKKLGAKANWFKIGRKKEGGDGMRRKGKRAAQGKKEHGEFEAPMFVPCTPGAELAKRLQKTEDSFTQGKGSRRIRMVETGGTTLKDILQKTNPWAKDGCGRQDCFLCKGGKGGDCMKENVCYNITCEECKARGKTTTYVGETSRTAYIRGKEHFRGLKNRSEENALWKHCLTVHHGQETNFSMKVVSSHFTPLCRQIEEGVLI